LYATRHRQGEGCLIAVLIYSHGSAQAVKAIEARGGERVRTVHIATDHRK
jgi:hypothetical protein